MFKGSRALAIGCLPAMGQKWKFMEPILTPGEVALGLVVLKYDGHHGGNTIMIEGVGALFQPFSRDSALFFRGNHPFVVNVVYLRRSNEMWNRTRK
jgi:hypothetical protein